MAMTLRLDDDDLRILRAQAEAEGRSMQEVVRSAVREYAERRSQLSRVTEALDVLGPRYAGLLDRLSGT